MTKASGFLGGTGSPLVIGHRGAPWQARENSLAAFRAARADGADGVEFDVRRTADAALVIHHDAVLRTGEAIVDLDLATLFQLDPDIPTLDAALDACDGLVANVEIKNWPTEPDFDAGQAVARAVAQRVDGVAGVVVSSFNLFALERVLEVAAGVEVALLGAHMGPDHVEGWITDAHHRGFHGVHPEAALVNPEVVAFAHELGLAVRVWTVDEPDRVREVAAAGVDAVITNDPAGARAALAGFTA